LCVIDVDPDYVYGSSPYLRTLDEMRGYPVAYVGTSSLPGLVVHGPSFDDLLTDRGRARDLSLGNQSLERRVEELRQLDDEGVDVTC
jgi:hypothetical protein